MAEKLTPEQSVELILGKKGVKLSDRLVIIQAIREHTHDAVKAALDGYTKFLLDCNYVDDDVLCEKPKAVDRYLNEKT